jgi:NhaP-type Na+/H+ or K+/H+ antiporter
VVLGVVVPAAAVLLIRSRFTSSTPLYASLGGLSIGLMVLGIASVTHANLFLAAFTAGITIATLAPDVEKSFGEFGELVTELLKLAAILVFGALISPAFLGEIPFRGYVFALLALLLARPLAIFLSLLRSHLPLPEQAVAAWFGPKGFASVVYGLLILEAGVPRADEMFHLIALVIFASILAHSSTDVPIAHAFARAEAHRRGDPAAKAPAPHAV